MEAARPAERTESIETIARRAIDRSTLRASVLLDREFVVRWAQPTVLPLLRFEPEEMVGVSAFEFLDPEEVKTIASILEFEQVIDVAIRSAIKIRSVRCIRVRCGDGETRTFEAALSNQFDIPDVGHLLIDIQAPSQLHHAYEAIEMTRLGADVKDILRVILTELTGVDPGGVAAALLDSDGGLLAATDQVPPPWGDTDPTRFGHTWTVPLLDASSATPAGTLQVWCTLVEPHPFDVETSQQIAGHAALVIGRDRALQDLRAAVFVDSLTGLANRRALEADLVDRRKASHPVLAAYIDLDGFKAVNDRIGHDAGDEVLKIVAQRLRQSLRSGDLVARMGGDEFVLLLGAPAPRGEALIARLQAVIGKPMTIDGQLVSVSASVGVSEGFDDARSLVRRADQAMLERKRNRPSSNVIH